MGVPCARALRGKGKTKVEGYSRARAAPLGGHMSCAGDKWVQPVFVQPVLVQPVLVLTVGHARAAPHASGGHAGIGQHAVHAQRVRRSSHDAHEHEV